MNKQKVLMGDLYPLIAQTVELNGSVSFTVSGVSMQPMLYNKRDTVTIVKKQKNNKLKKYDLPFYLMDDGRFIMHRVIRIHKDGTYECRGDNCWTSEDPIRDDQIIGVVKSFTRNGKKVDVDKSVLYFLYTRTWPFLHYFKKWYCLVRKIKTYKKYLNEFFHPEKVEIKKKDGTMSTITYRDARPGDVEQLISLVVNQLDYEKESFQGVQMSRSWVLSKDGKKHYESMIKNKFVHVAFDDKKMIAFFIGKIDDRKFDDFPMASCAGVYVNPEYRGAGIAQNLLEKFKVYCKEHDCKHIGISFYADNTAAEALYKKSGFSDYKKTYLCELD